MVAIANRRSIMTLYANELDTHCHQVRLVLQEKNAEYNVIDVRPDIMPEDLIEINPYHTIPTLIDRDLVLYNTNIILEYLEERFPHPPLLPVYPVDRARNRILLYRIERDWFGLVKKIEHGDEQQAQEARKQLTDSIISIAKVFDEKPYLFSDEYTLVDSYLAPLLWRLPHWGIQLPKQADAVIKYAHRLFERDAFLDSLTEAEREIEHL